MRKKMDEEVQKENVEESKKLIKKVDWESWMRRIVGKQKKIRERKWTETQYVRK